MRSSTFQIGLDIGAIIQWEAEATINSALLRVCWESRCGGEDVMSCPHSLFSYILPISLLLVWSTMGTPSPSQKNIQYLNVSPGWAIQKWSRFIMFRPDKK